MASIIAINLVKGYAVRDDGVAIPFLGFFDENGDACTPDDALTFVAGTSYQQLPGLMSNFRKVTVH